MHRRTQHCIGALGVLLALGVQAAVFGPPSYLNARDVGDNQTGLPRKLTDVDLCDLVARPEDYDDQFVRVHGVVRIVSGANAAVLYSRDACPRPSPFPSIALRYDGAYDAPSADAPAYDWVHGPGPREHQWAAVVVVGLLVRLRDGTLALRVRSLEGVVN